MDTFIVTVIANNAIVALIAVAASFVGYAVVKVTASRRRGEWDVEVRNK